MAKLALDGSQVAGFFNQVLAHGVAGIMGRVALDASQTTYLIEHRIDHPGVETTVAVGVGCRRKKQRRRFPFLNIGGSLFGHIIFDRGHPLPRKFGEGQVPALD